MANIDENLSRYLNYSVVQHDHKVQDGTVQFVHTKLSYLHIVTMLSADKRQEWSYEYDVHRQGKLKHGMEGMSEEVRKWLID